MKVKNCNCVVPWCSLVHTPLRDVELLVSKLNSPIIFWVGFDASLGAPMCYVGETSFVLHCCITEICIFS